MVSREQTSWRQAEGVLGVELSAAADGPQPSAVGPEGRLEVSAVVPQEEWEGLQFWGSCGSTEQQFSWGTELCRSWPGPQHLCS